MLALCRWMADYYAVPLGVALRTALPASLTGAAAPIPARKTHRIAVLRRDRPSLLASRPAFRPRAPPTGGRRLSRLLGGRSPVDHLTDPSRCSVLGRSRARGPRARAHRGRSDRARSLLGRGPAARRGSHAVARAAARDRRADRGGAGRRVSAARGHRQRQDARVYRAASRDRRSARAIGDRARARDRAHAADGRSVSRRVRRPGRGAAQRAQRRRAVRRVARAAQSGAKRIAVGARSAIFAPLRNLGAIIVDEEHEASYKQGESPRYHAREVAIVRARQAGAVAVLGSATPSLETWTNAASGKYRLPDAPGARRRRRAALGRGRRPARRSGTPRRRSRRPCAADPFASVISEPLEIGAARDARARRAEHPPAQPARLRVVRAVRGVR